MLFWQFNLVNGFMFQPGQASMAQSSLMVASPSQTSSATTCSSRVHCLTRRCWPPPQVLEHSSGTQLVQTENPNVSKCCHENLALCIPGHDSSLHPTSSVASPGQLLASMTLFLLSLHLLDLGRRPPPQDTLQPASQDQPVQSKICCQNINHIGIELGHTVRTAYQGIVPFHRSPFCCSLHHHSMKRQFHSSQVWSDRHEWTSIHHCHRLLGNPCWTNWTILN